MTELPDDIRKILSGEIPCALAPDIVAGLRGYIEDPDAYYTPIDPKPVRRASAEQYAWKCEDYYGEALEHVYNAWSEELRGLVDRYLQSRKAATAESDRKRNRRKGMVVLMLRTIEREEMQDKIETTAEVIAIRNAFWADRENYKIGLQPVRFDPDAAEQPNQNVCVTVDRNPDAAPVHA